METEDLKELFLIAVFIFYSFLNFRRKHADKRDVNGFIDHRSNSRFSLFRCKYSLFHYSKAGILLYDVKFSQEINRIIMNK